ncbi:MAG: putative baseplate assembly protein, partial [Acidobacteriota bacterium]|nr:putative baseplate assembly protein [Acidobacteriota bacterium]
QVLQRVELVETQAKENRTKVTLQNATPPPPPPPPAPGTPFGKLLTMVDTLLQDPASHPRNSLQLARSVSQTFSPKADTAPSLLATLHPQLATQLYDALENAEVAPEPSARVFALRASAAPFGSNAPLKPILDERGAVAGTEEWPLAGSVVLSVSIPAPGRSAGNLASTSAVGFVTQQNVMIAIRQDSVIDSVTLTSPVSGPVPVGSHTVQLDIKDRSAEFKFQDFSHTLAIAYDPMQPNIVGVKIDSDAVRQASLGQSIRLISSGRRISIMYTFGAIQVSYETPLAPDPKLLPLDAVYDQIVPGSWAVIERPDSVQPIITQIDKVRKTAKAAYGISGRITQLTLNKQWLDPDKDLMLSVARNVNVSAQSEELTLAEEPIENPVCGNGIELDGLYAGLESGRWLIVEGERTGIPSTSGVRSAELVMLAAVEQNTRKVKPDVAAASASVAAPSAEIDLPGDNVHSFLQLASGLSYCYKRDTVAIHGNVVRSTHGETRSEVLGSGDGGQALQQFTLHQSPLTFLAAPTSAGAASTLQVRVNDILWRETDSLASLGPTDRGYLTQTGDDGKTSVIFGSGRTGARVPTGTENIRAVYRNGIGEPGNVAAGRISLLATRPLGVKDVINPLPGTGGADRESRDDARDNAPLGVTALDRLVSVQDYADFARTFAGIGKASAVRISDGNRQIVHLTIAGAGDIGIDTNSDLYLNLNQALYQLGDPHQALRVEIRELMLIVIAANVKLLPDYEWESVAVKIRSALLDSLDFARRDLGEDVLLSQVIATIQRIEGVAYVNVDALEILGEDFTEGDLTRLAGHGKPEVPIRIKLRIPVKLARVDPTSPPGTRRILPAQIAYLSP